MQFIFTSIDVVIFYGIKNERFIVPILSYDDFVKNKVGTLKSRKITYLLVWFIQLFKGKPGLL